VKVKAIRARWNIHSTWALIFFALYIGELFMPHKFGWRLVVANIITFIVVLVELDLAQRRRRRAGLGR
jgi:hypothetical protein